MQGFNIALHDLIICPMIHIAQYNIRLRPLLRLMSLYLTISSDAILFHRTQYYFTGRDIKRNVIS